MKMSIGVDLHKTQFTVCFLSEDRRIEAHRLYPTTESGYEDFFTQCNEFEKDNYDLQAAVESTGNARFFRNQLITKGIGVVVVNTMKFKVINESVKKTDKHDAKTLAEFLEKDMLPESRLCSQMSEDIRRILKSRQVLVKATVSIKNQLHGMLMGYGIETKTGQFQSKRERQRILNGLMDHDIYGGAVAAVEPLFEIIDRLSVDIKNLEVVLASLIAEDEDVNLLMSIPGVGLITASTIRAHIDDINRYESAKKFASYMGLAPWVQNSNETIHHGHITKRGPQELRTAMVQCVLGMVRTKSKTENFRLMVNYRLMKKHKGSGTSIIATARKLSTIMYTMLKTREPFDPIRMENKKKYLDMQAAALDAAKIQNVS